MAATRWRLVNQPLVKRRLGDPRHHHLAECSGMKTEIRCAWDGNGYTFREFEEWYHEETSRIWNESRALNGKVRYRNLFEIEKIVLMEALTRILCEQVDIIMGRKVLSHPRVARVLPHCIRRLFATFFAIGEGGATFMIYGGCNMQRRYRILNKSMRNTTVTG